MTLSELDHLSEVNISSACVQEELLYALSLSEGVFDLSSSLVRLNLSKEGQMRLKHAHQYSGDIWIEID